MAEGIGECASNNLPCSPSVQAIDHKSVHQICSGQVILNLATAVKELVENSLDAEAKIIDVKLKEHGAEVVEVIDDGCGVKPENFAALTLKHFTSKLRDFSDLTSVETFGFRGEALSSLCALSDLSITTRHNSENVGTKLEYDHNGKISTRTPCAREHGTTVTLHNLFATLPVRHKEFLRNLKKEYCKLLQVLHAYCIISSGVRISCSNQLDKGRRNLLVATNGSLNLKENISSVFGPKQTQNLLAFQQVEPSEEECEIYGLKQEEVKSKAAIFQISGYVSKAEHGMGRSSADRQFFYINKRPCDISKVSRVVNEVYHMYNRHQYPFVLMDISLARDSVDVNVTPDKRQVFVQEEKLLLAIVKSSLKNVLDPGSSTYDVNQGLQSKGKRESPSLLLQNLRRLGKSLKERSFSVSDEKPDSAKVHSTLFPPLASFKRKSGFSDVGSDIPHSEPRAKQRKLTAIFGPSTTKKELDEDGTSQNCKDCSWIQDPSTRCSISEEREQDNEDGQNIVLHSKDNEHSKTLRNDIDKLDCSETLTETTEEYLSLKEYNNNSSQANTADVSKLSIVIDSVVKNTKKNKVYAGSETKDTTDCGFQSCAEPNKTAGSYGTNYENLNLAKIVTSRRSVDIEFNMNEIQKFCKASNRQSNKHDNKGRLFRAKILPENNEFAEEELKKHVTKEMFDKMEILGQFNLGFIITKLEDDLFLIDQHASDEKFNFEDLQRNSELKCQKLIHPLQLELTAVNESVLLENLEIFHKNGFDFIIDEQAAPMKRMKLASLPTSKNWTFGVEDIEELIFMLSDSPGSMCRPSRVRKMFASRACRMSIMVGTALDHRKMKHVVSHMGQMDQPWNCPHGRPTMRHLINLRMISAHE